MNNKISNLLFLCLFIGCINCIGRECTWEKREIDLSWYLPSFKPGSCAVCPDNCQSCTPVDEDGKNLKCNDCLPGFYMDLNFECNTCEEDCQSCIGPTINQCYQPKDGEFYNHTSHEFQECAIPNCGSCSKDGKICYGCDSGYYNVYDVNYTIASCGICDIEYCLYCYASYEWNEIPDAMNSKSIKDSSIEEDDSFNIIKKPNSVSCSYCDYPYHWNSVDNVCQKCLIENCAYCSSLTKSDGSNFFGCSWCESGYMLLENNTCVLGNVSNCASYYMNSCSYCNSGFSLLNNTCVECKTIDPHCSYCYKDYSNQTSLICSSCEFGYFQNEDKVCEKCPDDCEGCYGYNNITYSENYTILSQSYVIQCYGNNNVNCQPYEQIDYETNTCFNNTIPGCMYAYSKNECSYCIDGYYYNTNNKSCEKCHSSCTTCSGPNDYDCSSCAVNKYKYYNASIIKMPEIYYFGGGGIETMKSASSAQATADSHAPPTNPNYENFGRILIEGDLSAGFGHSKIWCPPGDNNWRYRAAVQCLDLCPTTLLDASKNDVNVIVDNTSYECYGNYTNEKDIPYIVEDSIKETDDLNTVQDMAVSFASQLNSVSAPSYNPSKSKEGKNSMLDDFGSIEEIEQKIECNGNGNLVYVNDTFIGTVELCSCFDGYTGVQCEYPASLIDALRNKSIILADSINSISVNSTKDAESYLSSTFLYFSMNIAVYPQNISNVSSNLQNVESYIDYSNLNLYIDTVAAPIQQNYIVNLNIKSKLSEQDNSNLGVLRDLESDSCQYENNKKLFNSVLANIRSMLKKDSVNSTLLRRETQEMEVYKGTGGIDTCIKLADTFEYNDISMRIGSQGTQSSITFDDSYDQKKIYLAAISRTLGTDIFVNEFIATSFFLVESDNLQANYSAELTTTPYLKEDLQSYVQCGILDEELMAMDPEPCTTILSTGTVKCECNKEGVMAAFVLTNYETQPDPVFGAISILSFISLSLLLFFSL